MKPTPIAPDYASFLTEVKGRIQTARLQAGRAVNRELVMLYWDIGRGIVEKQKTAGWGEAVVERLAADLRAEFPDMRGFSSANIWRMRQLYELHSCPEFLAQVAREMTREESGGFLSQVVRELEKAGGSLILEQVVQEGGGAILGQPVPEFLAQVARELASLLPWWHHVELMGKVKDAAARLFYLRATAQFGWSRSVLLNQIKGQAYERAVKEKKTHNFELALPEHLAEQADEMLKSRYNLEFLGIARPMKELELEERLISRLQQFILELGYGFCFVGRQYRLALGKKNTSWTCCSTIVSSRRWWRLISRSASSSRSMRARWISI
jgi:predicted nuclease of restriction endonuclease-like (RecB) superfamily